MDACAAGMLAVIDFGFIASAGDKVKAGAGATAMNSIDANRFRANDSIVVKTETSIL